MLSNDYESKYGIELEDSVVDDQQMGSDHCPIQLLMTVPLDTEEETKVEDAKMEQEQEKITPIRQLDDVPKSSKVEKQAQTKVEEKINAPSV